jgi:hypothetical protein
MTMDAVFFSTSGGEDMVIHSRADDQAMVEKLADIEEDAVDLAIGLKRGSDLESGSDERLEEDLSVFLLRGAPF